MQTEEQLKSSSVTEGGFSLQRIKDNAENQSSASGRLVFGKLPLGSTRVLLFVGPGHARHTLLLPPGERPGRRLDEQTEQELVLQIRLVSLQQFEDGGAETEMQLEATRG